MLARALLLPVVVCGALALLLAAGAAADSLLLCSGEQLWSDSLQSCIIEGSIPPLESLEVPVVGPDQLPVGTGLKLTVRTAGLPLDSVTLSIVGFKSRDVPRRQNQTSAPDGAVVVYQYIPRPDADASFTLVLDNNASYKPAFWMLVVHRYDLTTRLAADDRADLQELRGLCCSGVAATTATCARCVARVPCVVRSASRVHRHSHMPNSGPEPGARPVLLYQAHPAAVYASVPVRPTTHEEPVAQPPSPPTPSLDPQPQPHQPSHTTPFVPAPAP